MLRAAGLVYTINVFASQWISAASRIPSFRGMPLMAAIASNRTLESYIDSLLQQLKQL